MLFSLRWVPGLCRRLLVEGPRLQRGLVGRGQGQAGLFGGVVDRWLWSGRAAACVGHRGVRSEPGEGQVGPHRRLPWLPLGVGRVEGLKGLAARGPKKGRGKTKEFDLNEEIKTLGGRNDAAGLFEIVRREGGDGKGESLDTFTHVNCGTWLNRLVRGDAKDLQGKPPAEVMQVLGRTLCLLRETPHVFDPRLMSNLANAVSQLQYRWEAGDRLHMVVLEELRTLVATREEGMEDFNAFDIASFLNAFAKMEFVPGKKVLVMAVARFLNLDKASIVPQDLSNVVNAFARFSIHPGKPLMDMVAGECVRRKLEGFKPQEISNIANAFAKLHADLDEELFKLISSECVRRTLEDCTSQHIANIVNAFAKLAFHPGEELLTMVSKECVRRGLRAFKPQEIASIANAYAKLGVNPGEELFHLILNECMRRGLEGFSSHGMANIANAFAKLAFLPGKGLLTIISRECVRRGLTGFKTQEISNIVNALAKLELHPGGELLIMISKECVRRGLTGFYPQHISNIVNAFAKLAFHPGEELLTMISKECVRRGLSGFNSQGVNNTANALAALRHYPGQELLGMVMEKYQGPSRLASDELDLGNVLHALATLGWVPDGKSMAGVYQQCEEIGWETFTNSGLQNVFWACAVLEVQIDKGLLEAVTGRLKSFMRGGAEGLDYEEDALKLSRVVRHALFLCEPTREEGLQELREAAEAVWEVVKGRDKPPTESRLQQGVFAALTASYVTVDSEVMVSNGLLSLDAVITLPCGAKVGVEVDGPHHFFSNQPDVPIGATMLKRRMLDKSVERGLLQGWVSVRNRNAEELAKVEEVVRRVGSGAR